MLIVISATYSVIKYILDEFCENLLGSKIAVVAAKTSSKGGSGESGTVVQAPVTRVDDRKPATVADWLKQNNLEQLADR